ncbi:hypothetical protein B0H13DRAFT_2088619 [Mycena leptocephala]|nr:hypothetical protein B0H13DRAFT_2088619 [Mycena leptocephala]
MSQDTRALRILHTVWQGKHMTPEEIDMLWILRPGTCRLALRGLDSSPTGDESMRGLHSLVYVPPPDTEFLEWTGVDVLHASFRDYLCDERRSKRWCVATPALHSDYLHHLVKLLSSRPASRQTQYLYRRLVTSLPKLLASCKPAEALFDLLRDEQFLNNIFLADEIDEPGWPKRYSTFPEDLIQAWQDHHWISNFEWTLQASPSPSSRSFYPSKDLLAVMQSKARGFNDGAWIECLSPDQSPRTIFQPFLDAREALNLPIIGGRACFRQGNSPINRRL